MVELGWVDLCNEPIPEFVIWNIMICFNLFEIFQTKSRQLEVRLSNKGGLKSRSDMGCPFL